MEKDPDLTDAMNYLNRVKEEYKDDITVYDHFLELMRDYKNGKNEAIMIVRAVEQLFKGKKYLVDGFANFLPRCMSDRIDQRKGYGQGERSASERGMGDRIIGDRLMGDRIMGDRIMGERMGDRIGMGERPISFDRSMNERMLTERPQMERPVERIGERLNDRPGERSGERPNERPNERISDRMYDRNYNPEMTKQVPFYFEDTNKQKRALQFVHKVKRRFINTPDTYKEFIQVLQIYQKSPTNADKILAQLKNLLSGHDDLLRDFVHFIPNNLSFINEILKQKELLQPFTKLLNMYNQNCVSAKDFVFLMRNVLNNERLLSALAAFINYKVEGDEVPVKKLRKIGSYRVYPEEMRSVDCLRQDSVARAVLNNFCMISAFGSEETTFLASRKNAYEEVLYKIEDERYECELNIFRIGDFVVSLEELFERIMLERKQTEGAETQDESYTEFTVQDINMPAGIVQEVLSIVYRDKAIDILEGILTKPQISIPIVLKRLYLVYNRLKVDMNEKNKLWREITVKNIYRARECSPKRERRPETYTTDCIDDFVGLYEEYAKVVSLEGKDVFERVVAIIKDEASFCFYASGSLAGILRLTLEACDCLNNLKMYFNKNDDKDIPKNDKEKDDVDNKISVDSISMSEAKNEVNMSESMDDIKSLSMNELKGVEKNRLKEDNENKGELNESKTNELRGVELNNPNDMRDAKTNDVFYSKSEVDEELTFNTNNDEIPKILGVLPPEEVLRNDPSKKNYSYILTLIKQNLSGESDNQTFEDTLRLITDSRGQRIYAIEKTMLKIDRHCNALKTEDGSMKLLDCIKKRVGRYAAEVLCENERVYMVTKKGSIRIEEVKEGEDKLREVVRFFMENDERDDENVYADYGLEMVVDESYKIKYVENTADFVMRRGKKRTLGKSENEKSK